jgi:prepilin-type N-terminal cleavage/methylation domain-containing protein
MSLVKGARRGQAGFTLIEMLIVIILLGILAAIIIPQVSVTTDDAKLSALKSDLTSMRNAIELYYVQHNNVYPGEHDITGGAPADAAAAAAARRTPTICWLISKPRRTPAPSPSRCRRKTRMARWPSSSP